MEDIVFLRDNSLSLETVNDFRTILSRQRKVVLTLFVRQRLNSEEEEEVKESYKKREIQEKLADIILLSWFNGNDVSDIKLDATILLAALTKSVKGRSEDLQDAIARELITALRATSENELLCNEYLESHTLTMEQFISGHLSVDKIPITEYCKVELELEVSLRGEEKRFYQ
eukprot:gene12502-13684_t